MIDPAKVRDHEMGALADYISFLALAEPRSLDDCEKLPSILNLLAPNCAGAEQVSAVSDEDVSFLRGVYRMGLFATAPRQKDQIAAQMKQGGDAKE